MSRTHTPFPNDKLSRWHFAVQHAIYRVKHQICINEIESNDNTYELKQLEQLQDLDMFLSMSWDAWMDELCESAKVATKRVTNTAEGSSDV